MKYLVVLILSLVTLFIFIKRAYKISSVQDSIGAPIDYENTQSYKDSEMWFSGVGRHWYSQQHYL